MMQIVMDICKTGNDNVDEQKTLLEAPTVLKSPHDLDSCKKNPLAVVADCMKGSGYGSCANISSMNAGKDVVPGLLLELVTIATRIAKMDQMLGVIGKVAPADSPEAAKFHQISMQGLAHSRKTLQAQQATILKLLGSVTGANSSASSASECASQNPGMSQDLDKSSFKLKQTDEDIQSQCSTTISGDDVQQSATDSDSDGSKSPLEKPGELDGIQSLRLNIEKLKNYPSGCSLMVKNIKHLGFDSATALQNHFSCYGPVEDVLVSHSITKPSATRKKGRMRPAAMGFVVMRASEDVKKVIDAVAEHVIDGVLTEVSLFQQQVLN